MLPGRYLWTESIEFAQLACEPGGLCDLHHENICRYPSWITEVISHYARCRCLKRFLVIVRYYLFPEKLNKDDARKRS